MLKNILSALSALSHMSMDPIYFSGRWRAPFIALKAEDTVHIHNEPHHFSHLLLNLLRGAEDVRIVLGKLPHPEQSVKNSGLFVPVHKTKLKKLEREITVRMAAVPVYKKMTRTVHRFYSMNSLIDLGEIHVFPVFVPVAAPVPELLIENNGCFYLMIPCPEVTLAAEIDNSVVEHHAIWMPEGKSGSLLMKREEIELFS
jgi:hypothetical protein